MTREERNAARRASYQALRAAGYSRAEARKFDKANPSKIAARVQGRISPPAGTGGSSPGGRESGLPAWYHTTSDFMSKQLRRERAWVKQGVFDPATYLEHVDEARKIREYLRWKAKHGPASLSRSVYHWINRPGGLWDTWTKPELYDDRPSYFYELDWTELYGSPKNDGL